MALSHPLLPDGADRGSPGWAQFYLQSSYTLAAWAWRSWEFAVALLLMDLYPDSLLLVSVYGIADNVVRVLLGSFLGSYIARQRIIPAATLMYLIQNVCIGTSAVSALLLLAPDLLPDMLPNVQQPPWLPQALLSVLIGMGALSSVGSAGVRITVEVEATAALAAGDSQHLSKLNAQFRAIDLACLLLAPVGVGAALTYLGPAQGTLVLSGYAILAWLPEIVLLRLAVARSPHLRSYKSDDLVGSSASDLDETQEYWVQRAADLHDPESPRPLDPHVMTTGAHEKAADAEARSEGHSDQEQADEWQEDEVPSSAIVAYVRSPVVLPNVALAFLYCTVLSLGFLMTGYLQWTGLTSAEVSMYRGAGAVTGLLATFLFPFLRQRLGLVATGLCGILWQFGSLLLGCAPVALNVVGKGVWPPGALQPSQDLVRMLVGGVVASRTGLWVFDLSVTQLIQEQVPPHTISMVCGVQSSLQACFEMLSFLAGVYLQDPKLFYWLMLGSLGFVACAAFLYTVFAIRQTCRQGDRGTRRPQT